MGRKERGWLCSSNVTGAVIPLSWQETLLDGYQWDVLNGHLRQCSVNQAELGVKASFCPDISLQLSFHILSLHIFPVVGAEQISTFVVCPLGELLLAGMPSLCDKVSSFPPPPPPQMAAICPKPRTWRLWVPSSALLPVWKLRGRDVGWRWLQGPVSFPSPTGGGITPLFAALFRKWVLSAPGLGGPARWGRSAVSDAHVSENYCPGTRVPKPGWSG